MKRRRKSSFEYDILQTFLILNPANWIQAVDEKASRPDSDQVVLVSSQRNIEAMTILKDSFDHLSRDAQDILFYVLSNKEMFYTTKDKLSRNKFNLKRVERLFYKRWHNRKRVLKAIEELKSFVVSF